MRPLDQVSANPFYAGNFPAYSAQMQPGLGNIQASQNSILPSLYNSQQDYGSPTYAEGGQVSLKDIAQHLSNMGQGDDSVLAHIHPLEAMELSKKYGSSGINPITGLPQYGFKIGRFFKKLLPVVGAVVGSVLGGPAGGTIGGALGGAAKGQSGKHGLFKGSLLKPSLTGAGIGLGTGLGAQMLGMGPGASGMSALGKGVGQSGGFLSNIGLSNIPGLSSLFSGGAGGAGAAAGQGGILSSLGGSNLLQNGLLGAAALGIMKGKMKPAKYEAPQYTPLPELPAPREHWRPDQQPTPYTPRERVLRGFHPNVYKAGELPEFEYFEPDSPLRAYAHGGYAEHGGYTPREAGRYFHGEGGGQADKILSLLSPTEYVLDSDFMANLGDGDPDEGARKVDAARIKLRREKRSASVNKIPPKAKSFEHYLKARRR
jgi:hypothetical protein